MWGLQRAQILCFISFFLFSPPNLNTFFLYFPHFEASGFQFDLEIRNPAFQIKPKPRPSEEFSSTEMGKSGYFFLFFDIFSLRTPVKSNFRIRRVQEFLNSAVICLGLVLLIVKTPNSLFLCAARRRLQVPGDFIAYRSLCKEKVEKSSLEKKNPAPELLLLCTYP